MTERHLLQQEISKTIKSLNFLRNNPQCDLDTLKAIQLLLAEAEQKLKNLLVS